MRSTVLFLVFLATSPVSAFFEHAKITLDVTTKGETTTAYVDQTPPDHGKNPRPVVKVKAGDPIKINWMLTNVNNAFPKPFHETNPLSARTHLNFSNSIIFSKSKQ
jgi:hypothetical protein